MPTPKKGAINAEFIEIEDGTSVGLSSGTNVRIRANSGSGFAEVSAFGGAYTSLGQGGLSSIPVGSTIFVDAVNGNDGTGTSDRQDLPFLTVGAALAAASSGDLVEVGPGTYTEQGLTVPSGVLLRGSGWTVTKIGDNAGTANILTWELTQPLRVSLLSFQPVLLLVLFIPPERGRLLRLISKALVQPEAAGESTS